MTFHINQVFAGEYPPDAARWCNENGAYIEEIDPVNGSRHFQIKAVPEPTAEELAERALAEAKAVRSEAVGKLVVDVDGMEFDANEAAQDRMARTITAAQALGGDLEKEKRVWVLADNSIAQPTIAQLAEALRKAGDAQTALWTVPYEQ